MPVQYKDTAQAQSIIDSVKHVRSKAGLGCALPASMISQQPFLPLFKHTHTHTHTHTGLFDVSHMCSLRWRGKDAIKFVESVTVADVQGMPMHTGADLRYVCVCVCIYIYIHVYR